MKKEKQVRKFDRQAKMYERNREPSSMRKWRKELIRNAEGNVLELAVGAGANFPYYLSGVSVTAADFSEEMLERARIAAGANGVRADFICGDIETLEFEPHSFDTVVSTLSFCCYESPLEMLRKVKKWCKPEGKILLMEHGISTNPVVSTLQRTLNPLLYRMIGCHHNRDIEKMVRDAGISVNRVDSHWMNMMRIIWAEPRTN